MQRRRRKPLPDAYAPLLVGLGGTTRPESTSERVLIKALEAAERAGAKTRLFGGGFLSRLPIYDPSTGGVSTELEQMLATVRQADGILISTPGYHGSVSGLIKNTLDALEGLRGDERPYLDGRAVGCIVTADGWQACGTALSSLRTIVHALRGWPTPLGVTLNPAAARLFDHAGAFCDEGNARQVEMLAGQVVAFARATHG